MDCEHRWRVAIETGDGISKLDCVDCGDELELHGPKKDHECRWTSIRYHNKRGDFAYELMCLCGATTPVLEWVAQTQHAGAINRAMQAAGDQLLRLLRDPIGFEVPPAIKAWQAVTGRAPKAAAPVSLLDLLIRFYDTGLGQYDFLQALKELKRNGA